MGTIKIPTSWTCLSLALFLGLTFAQEKPKAPAAAVNQGELEKSKVGKLVANTTLHLLDSTGENYVAAKLTSVPRYYLLYFSASW